MAHPMPSSERRALGVLLAGSNLLCFEVGFHLKRCQHGVETETTYFSAILRANEHPASSSSRFRRAGPGRRGRAHTSSWASCAVKSSSSRRQEPHTKSGTEEAEWPFHAPGAPLHPQRAFPFPELSTDRVPPAVKGCQHGECRPLSRLNQAAPSSGDPPPPSSGPSRCLTNAVSKAALAQGAELSAPASCRPSSNLGTRACARPECRVRETRESHTQGPPLPSAARQTVKGLVLSFKQSSLKFRASLRNEVAERI